MNVRKSLTTGAAVVALMATTAFAQDIFHDIDRARHPYLGGAQELIAQAYAKISEGQKVVTNMGGHAQHAKELLEQASKELKLAEDTEKHP
jgi:hypothetical protein